MNLTVERTKGLEKGSSGCQDTTIECSNWKFSTRFHAAVRMRSWFRWKKSKGLGEGGEWKSTLVSCRLRNFLYLRNALLVPRNLSNSYQRTRQLNKIFEMFGKICIKLVIFVAIPSVLWLLIEILFFEFFNRVVKVICVTHRIFTSVLIDKDFTNWIRCTIRVSNECN